MSRTATARQKSWRGATDWPAFLPFIVEMGAIGGLIMISVIVAFVFGREYTEGMAKNMLALPIPLLVVGCAMTHATLAGFLNITRVELTMPELRTWHHPLPCRPIRQFAAPLMSHAICQQCGWHWRGFGARYVVKIALRDGTSSAFLAISDPAIADFLEHAINGFYRLDDGHAALEAV